ncbi:MAG: hypothetical protein NTZ67_03275 [Gammaproteobacteria bacterium]|nr:hypothetical protein [Gammaproteobacteria bacterium]
MPIPSRYSVYLHSDLHEIFENADSIVDSVTRYMNGENAGIKPKIEHWHGTDFLVLRTDRQSGSRAFLQRVMINRQYYLILHSITVTHDHYKDTRTQPFSNVMDKAPTGYVLHTPLNDLAQPIAQGEHNIEWQDHIMNLTDVQVAAAHSCIDHPVTILSGPPGSGKSLSVFASMQAHVRKCESENKSASLLFVCETPELLRYLKRVWHEWYRSPKNNKFKVTVTFENYQSIVSNVLMDDDELKKVITDPKAHFISFLESSPKKNRALSSSDIFHELLLHSDILHHDFSSQNNFSNSDYKATGKRHHLFNDEQLRLIYDLYCRYRQSIADTHINLLFEPIETKIEKYSALFVDEAHVYSLIQLLMLCDLGNESIFVIDSHQSACAIANYDRFISQLSKRKCITPNVIYLPVTYRTPKIVTDLLNRMLRIKNEVHGGLLSKDAYIKIETDENQIEGTLSLITTTNDEDQLNQLKQFGKSIGFAVIIFSEASRIEAASRYGISDMIFTINQIRGLEFEQVVLFKPFSETISHEISKDCALLDVNSPSKAARPDSKTLSENESKKAAYLNDLLVAASRTTRDLIIEDESAHFLKVRNLLGSLQGKSINEAVIAPQKQSTRDEIIEQALTFFKNDNEKLARSILKSRLGIVDREIDILLGMTPVAAVSAHREMNTGKEKVTMKNAVSAAVQPSNNHRGSADAKTVIIRKILDGKFDDKTLKPYLRELVLLSNSASEMGIFFEEHLLDRLASHCFFNDFENQYIDINFYTEDKQKITFFYQALLSKLSTPSKQENPVVFGNLSGFVISCLFDVFRPEFYNVIKNFLLTAKKEDKFLFFNSGNNRNSTPIFFILMVSPFNQYRDLALEILKDDDVIVPTHFDMHIFGKNLNGFYTMDSHFNGDNDFLPYFIKLLTILFEKNINLISGVQFDFLFLPLLLGLLIRPEGFSLFRKIVVSNSGIVKMLSVDRMLSIHLFEKIQNPILITEYLLLKEILTQIEIVDQKFYFYLISRLMLDNVPVASALLKSSFGDFVVKMPLTQFINLIEKISDREIQALIRGKLIVSSEGNDADIAAHAWWCSFLKTDKKVLADEKKYSFLYRMFDPDFVSSILKTASEIVDLEELTADERIDLLLFQYKAYVYARKNYLFVESEAFRQNYCFLENCLDTIDVTGLKKEEVVFALYNVNPNADVDPNKQGFFFRAPLLLEEIHQLLPGKNMMNGYIDYLNGKPMKINLATFPKINVINYDRDNGGKGTALRLIGRLREKMHALVVATAADAPSTQQKASSLGCR